MTRSMVGHLDLDAVVLVRGVHLRRTDEVSLLEAVAWWAGEPHSDAPACVTPTLAAFVRTWADALDDDMRQRLKAWIPRLAEGTERGGDARRALLLADFAARTATPAFLRAAGLPAEATLLRQAAAVTGWASAVSIRPVVEQAYAAARVRLDAAWAVRGGGVGVAQAAQQATRHAAAAAAAAALEVALGSPEPGELEVLLAGALEAALLGEDIPQLADRLERVQVRALRSMHAAVAGAMDAAALAAALHAPPDAAAAALRPTVQQVQAAAFDLLDRLCAED